MSETSPSAPCLLPPPSIGAGAAQLRDSPPIRKCSAAVATYLLRRCRRQVPAPPPPPLRPASPRSPPASITCGHRRDLRPRPPRARGRTPRAPAHPPQAPAHPPQAPVYPPRAPVRAPPQFILAAIPYGLRRKLPPRSGGPGARARPRSPLPVRPPQSFARARAAASPLPARPCGCFSPTAGAAAARLPVLPPELLLVKRKKVP